jgi:hypothetical protein
MEDAGFETAKMTILEKGYVANGDALVGLRDFMVQDFGKLATKGWSEDDVQQWERAVDDALKEEIDEFGGLKFEAWVVLAKK